MLSTKNNFWSLGTPGCHHGTATGKRTRGRIMSSTKSSGTSQDVCCRYTRWRKSREVFPTAIGKHDYWVFPIIDTPTVCLLPIAHSFPQFSTLASLSPNPLLLPPLHQLPLPYTQTPLILFSYTPITRQYHYPHFPQNPFFPLKLNLKHPNEHSKSYIHGLGIINTTRKHKMFFPRCGGRTLRTSNKPLYFSPDSHQIIFPYQPSPTLISRTPQPFPHLHPIPCCLPLYLRKAWFNKSEAFFGYKGSFTKAYFQHHAWLKEETTST